MVFNFGFIYKGVRYGWKDKKLYRLPFERNLKTFGLLEVPAYVFKTTTVYNVQRTKLTINRLKLMTENVNWQINQISSSDVPF